ncbi:MAG: hypothetical protein MJE77_20935 [Proteobacteria bacterium]|nr:hypothetical protein [Pseudomonadota bacterium]
MRKPLAIWLIAVALAVACSTSSPVSREIGARCQGHDDCDEMCLSGDDYPDGFCSQSCDKSGDCAGDAICVDIDQGVCLFSCQSAADCEFLGPGWTCQAKPSRPAGDTEVNVCVGD